MKKSSLPPVSLCFSLRMADLQRMIVCHGSTTYSQIDPPIAESQVFGRVSKIALLPMPRDLASAARNDSDGEWASSPLPTVLLAPVELALSELRRSSGPPGGVVCP